MRSSGILIVDDETLLLKLIRDVILLSCEGARVETAASAYQALERISTNDYDAILSDIQMRGMSGIELVRETRRLRPAPTIVLMTGDHTLLAEAFDSGAYTCLLKPLPWDRLTEVLRRATEFNRMQKRVHRLMAARAFSEKEKSVLWDHLLQQIEAAQVRMAQMRVREWQEVGPVRQTGSQGAVAAGTPAFPP